MRIAIAHASESDLHSLGRVLAKDNGYEIAWLARNAGEAIERATADRPDILLLDVNLPDNAVRATQGIMAQSPCPILILTRPPTDQTARVFDALGAGAIDSVAGPRADGRNEAGMLTPLLARIEAVARKQGGRQTKPPSNPSSLLVIGASAGGPPALATLLSALPADFPAAVLIAQHIGASFVPQMASWLDAHCPLSVRIAKHGDTLARGTVFLAGGPQPLTLMPAARLEYSAAPCDSPYRLVIDALFESVAVHWRGRLAGVLLTGMGHDGANGLKLLRDAHAFTIAQDQATSAVYGMPKAAAELGAAVAILPLKEIGSRLVAYFQDSRSLRMSR